MNKHLDLLLYCVFAYHRLLEDHLHLQGRNFDYYSHFHYYHQEGHPGTDDEEINLKAGHHFPLVAHFNCVPTICGDVLLCFGQPPVQVQEVIVILVLMVVHWEALGYS